MPHTLFLAPSGPSTGLTSAAMGLVRALDRLGLRVSFLKPVSGRDEETDRSVALIEQTTGLTPQRPLSQLEALKLYRRDPDELMEAVVRLHQAACVGADVVVVEGVMSAELQSSVGRFNATMAESLDTTVIPVAAPGSYTLAELGGLLDIVARPYGGIDSDRVPGFILTKIDAPEDERREAVLTSRQAEPRPRELSFEEARDRFRELERADFRLLGAVPWDPMLIAPRTADVACQLGARVLHAGDEGGRRVRRITLLARRVAHVTDQFTPGSLLVTPGDRDDIVLAVSAAAVQGVPLAGLVFTSGMEPEPQIWSLCQPALATGLPVYVVEHSSYDTAMALSKLDLEVPADDPERAGRAMDLVANHLDLDWFRRHCATEREPRVSPHAFRYRLVQSAAAADRRILLPEGDEPRTIEAAIQCTARGIARCALIAEPERVRRVAIRHGLALTDGLEIIDPAAVRARYVDALYERRRHKGMARPMAEEELADNVVLGTMMVELEEADGLVSGAVHTTANTIRPALQIIKTAPGSSIVSSVFFMLLPRQVLIYGDCAVNPDPTAPELAEIAIQSAETAAAFGLPARVAMISYSTGESGSGGDVDKVREATRLARERRGDLIIDGPLQYDAAAIPEVAASKAPDSPVAGRATVYVFPDLNTGNTTYKAVQRSAGVVSIGPMLQGLRKPVNDLSRGATVEDIVYTIALTAVQAAQSPRSSGTPVGSSDERGPGQIG
jgi:phosphate acetyltransferase